MSKRALLVALWLAVVLLVLTWSLLDYGSVPEQLKNEVLLRHGILMLGLSLPSGWLLSVLLGGALNLLGVELSGTCDVVAMSIACAVAGYVQWFVLVPWLWCKYKTRRRGADARV